MQPFYILVLIIGTFLLCWGVFRISLYLFGLLMSLLGYEKLKQPDNKNSPWRMKMRKHRGSRNSPWRKIMNIAIILWVLGYLVIFLLNNRNIIIQVIQELYY
jgi:hypothetical protein